MASIYQFKMDITGFSGGPGVNILHTTTGVADDPGDMGNFMNQMRNGWLAAAGYLLNSATFTVNPEVTKHNVETGLLEGVFSVTAPAPVTGGGADAAVPHMTQAVCRHNTDAVTAQGRRLIGRTFVGPVAGDAIDIDGTFKPAAVTAFNNMWGGMQDVAGTCRLVVWHRPWKGDADRPAYPGSFGHSQSTVTHDWVGVLRSRRS